MPSHKMTDLVSLYHRLPYPMRVLAASDDPFIHQFLSRQPSRESRILGESWSAMVESRRVSVTRGA